MSKIQNIDSHIIADIAERIERLITNARANVARVVNITEVITKYEIGRIIVNVVQEGEERATYGKQLLKGVSEVLTERLGDGWSVETLKRCRKFFTIYSVKQIGTTVLTESSDDNLVNTVDQIQKTVKSSTKLTETYPFTLSWSHYLVLMRIESEAERSFYEIECQKQNWSVRQLQRQYNSSLYERLALSRDKEAVMRLAQEGQTINNPDDIIKNPLTLEFLGLKSDVSYSETKLENAIILSTSGLCGHGRLNTHCRLITSLGLCCCAGTIGQGRYAALYHACLTRVVLRYLRTYCIRYV